MKPVDPGLLRASRPARLHMAAIGALAVLAAVVIVAQAVLITEIVVRGVDGESVGALVLALLAVLGARALIDGAFEAVGSFGAATVMTDLRGRLAEQLLLRRPGIDGRERTGELAALAVQGVDSAEPYFARFLPQLALAVTVPLAVLVWVFPRDWVSGLIMIGTLPLIPFFMALVGWATEAHVAKRWRTLSLLSDHFLDVIRGLPTLRAHVREDHQAEQLAEIGDRYRRETLGTLRIAFLSALVLELLAMISTALIAGAIGVRLAEGNMQLSDGLLVLLLAPELYMPLRQVGAQFHASADGLETVGALQAALAAPPAVLDPDASVEPAADPDPLRDGLVFDDVSFAYPGRDGDVLRRVRFDLAPGQTTALVGPSGAGKSTLAALALRLTDPSSGTVRCGPTDLRSLPADRWRALCTYLPQRPRIYHGTVAENLRLAKPNATDDELWDALLSAAAAELVAEGLPDGLDTVIGEGGRRLSAGEAQRLAIARAFLRDAPLLVLDEPAAHLDEETAASIDSALDRLRRGRTTLLIAHRVASTLRADAVVEIGDGELSGAAA